MSVKICSACKDELEATAKFFNRNTSTKDGLSYYCKSCASKAVMCSVKKNPVNTARIHKKYMQTQKGKAARQRANQKCRYGTVHGYLLRLYYDIYRRCNNSDRHNYKFYGGRGIKLHFTLEELEKYVKEEQIDPRSLEIHRKDNYANYTLSNIVFLTKSDHGARHGRHFKNS